MQNVKIKKKRRKPPEKDSGFGLYGIVLGTYASAGYAAATDRFVNNKDGTVTDTQTGLTWADHGIITGLVPRAIVRDIAEAGNLAGGCRPLMSWGSCITVLPMDL